MRIVEETIYHFDELSDKAKETARDSFRDMEPFWTKESIQSIEAFCDTFDVSLLDYSVDIYRSFYRTNASNANFRGKRLSQFNRDYMPTGYCLDNELWTAFYDVFKTTGDAKYAFNAALYAGFKAWREDMKYQTTDEYIDDFILANGYEFYENGKLF